MGAWVAFTVWVFVWVLMASFKTTGQIFSNPWGLPTSLHWENYAQAWFATDLATAMRNSVAVDVISTGIILALSAPAAYVLSRADFPGIGVLTNFFVIGIGIPVQVILIPLYLMLARVGLIDSLLGLGLEYVAISLPFTIYLLTGFFASLPRELEEAAAIDGASAFRTFIRVMLPLASPGLITAGVLNLVGLWNEFFLVFTLVNSNENFTLPVAIVNMYGNMLYTGNWAGLLAGVIIVVLPITVAYFWLSNRIIEGLTLGSAR
jgi:ABC-type glycerol-3-phosphate transport system permease component